MFPKRIRTRGLATVVLVFAGAVVASLPSASAHDDKGPIVIGHRGASAYRPEHTLAAYELAARMGADFIEPDLVPTKDGKLVTRHENEIGGTTNVGTLPEFADRKKTKTIDGVAITGWFTEDFTLAELKTLRAKERIPAIRPRNTLYDGRFEIPTLQEVIDLSKRLSRELHREIGIYPETKHPTYFKSIGLALEPKLVDTLNRNGLNRSSAKVYVQSFEVANLKELNRSLRVPIVQLVNGSGAPYDFIAAGDKRTYADLVTPAGLREVRSYADGVGLTKDLIIPRDAAWVPQGADHCREGRPQGRSDRALVDVPQRELVPARGLPVLDRPGRVRPGLRGVRPVLQAGHRRRVRGQPRHGRRGQGQALASASVRSPSSNPRCFSRGRTPSPNQ